MIMNEWHKVKDSLPEPYTAVIGYTVYDQGLYITHHNGSNWYQNKKITHWMECPDTSQLNISDNL